MVRPLINHSGNDVYEKKDQPLVPVRQFIQRISTHFLYAFALIFCTIAIGAIGHMILEPVDWHDAVLNTAFVMAGLGAFIVPQTVIGKIFLSFYSIFVGLIFMAALGLTLAPVAHRILHKFHLDDD